MSEKSFESPIFNTCGTKEELIDLLKRIISGDHIFEAWSYFRTNTRSVERGIKLMKESKTAANSMKSREDWARATFEHRKNFSSVDYYKKKQFHNEE